MQALWTARDGPTAVVGAALRAELVPFLALCGARPERRVDDLRIYSGHLDDRDVLCVVLGEGAHRAGRSVEVLLESVSPARFLLIGLAGGLSPGLDDCALVRAGTVTRSADRSFEVVTRSGAGQIAPGTVVSAPRVVGTAAEKRSLWQQYGRPERCVVDLESWTVAERLERMDCPYSIVRAVADAADEDLPFDVAFASARDGRIRRLRVLAGVLRNPSSAKDLLELRSRARRCARRLGDVARQWVEAPASDEPGSAVC